MRFRSLILDYKAEAVQIMREESNRERKRPRVIRILSDSCKESLIEGETETTSTTQSVPTANSDPQELPSWLSGSSLNECITWMNQTDVFTNAVVTPIGKTTADMNKPEKSGKSVGNLGSNDCNRTNSRQRRNDIPKAVDSEDTNRETKRTFDYKKLFSTPWLLEFVSSIRRRANRKRISNEAFEGCSKFFPISYHDRCPNDSFSFFHCKIIRRLFDKCWLQVAHKDSWKRLEALMELDFDRSTPPFVEQNDETKTSPNNEERFSLSDFVVDRRGSFASLLLPHFQSSTAIVVYRGHSTTTNSHKDTQSKANIQGLPLTGDKKKSLPFVPSELWETAILTAAALCAYQQQQKAKPKAIEDVTVQENVPLKEIGNGKLCFKTPSMRPEGKNQQDQSKTNNPNYTQDQQHAFDRHRRYNQNTSHRGFRSTSVEKVIFSEFCRPNVVETKKRKRSSSHSLLEENDNLLVSEPTDQSNTANATETNQENDPGVSHDANSDPTAHSNPRNSEQSPKSTPTNNRREKCKRSELFLLQRFGLLPDKMNGQIDGISTDLATNENDSDSSETGDNLIESKDGHGGASVLEEEGCSSPIEFPVCFDEYDEEEDQENDFNYNTAAEVETKGEQNAFSVSNDTGLVPENAPCYNEEFENGKDPIENDLAHGDAKLEVHPFTNPSNEHIAVKSSKKKKNGKKKKRRKRTAEEKILRKKEKRRRKEPESKSSNRLRGKEAEGDLADEDRSQNDGDKLETPRKLDFKKFSPVKTSTKGTDTEKSPNRFEHASSTRVLEKRKPIGNLDSTNHASNESVPFIENESAPRDPFLVGPDEILEAVTRDSHIPQGNVHKYERVHTNTLSLNGTDGRNLVAFPRHDKNNDSETPVSILCSESFIENFGETVSEITRSTSVVGGNSELSAFHQRSIQFVDTKLVDTCSVDIEIPSRVAMVVSTMSQIQNSGGLMANFLPRIVEVAARNRYTDLVVFLCVDIILDPRTARDLVRLQSAFLSCDRGLPRTRTAIQVCSKQSLAGLISRNIFRFIESDNGLLSNAVSKVDHWLSDERACLRLKFLLSIIPTLSVIGALYWLEFSVNRSTWSPLRNRNQHPITDKTSEWFQNIFQDVGVERRRLESYLLSSNANGSKLKDFMNPFVPNQLAFAVHIHLKHYY